MGFLKQLFLSVLLLLAAFVSWTWLDPGSKDFLDRHGAGWMAVVTASPNPDAEKRPEKSRSRNREVLVVGAQVTSGIVNDKLSAIGNGQAVKTVSVRPLVSGQISEILVKSGAKVENGDVIAVLDFEAEAIAVDRAKLALATAEQKAKRYANLLKNNSISSVEAEQSQIDYQNLNLQLREAELALARRTIKAPISGVIGILPVGDGDYVTSQSELATIDDRSKILVEFWVPERFAGNLQIGSPVNAVAISRPGTLYTGEITALDNRIDQASRTLRVRAEIENEIDGLRAGMAFRITMTFTGQEYPAVDPLAIQWDNNGSYVWLVSDGKADRRSVAIIQRNADRVLVEGNIAANDLVVVEGVQNVREGAAVKMLGAESEPASEKPGEPRKKRAES